jgi:hypothetical protein
LFVCVDDGVVFSRDDDMSLPPYSTG